MMERSSVIISRFSVVNPRNAALGCLAVIFLAIIGCGAGEARGRVAGKVTFQGQAVPEGIIVFSNDEKGVHLNTKLKPDGSYEIITAKGAGLSVGNYSISVCPPLPELAPVSADPAAAKRDAKQYPNIPQKYRDPKTSRLTLTVKEGDNQFDIAMQP
jgi:hypothetical protein